MDLRDGTLYTLLDSLDTKYEKLGWNIYQNKSGRTIVKISYGGSKNLDLNSETQDQTENVSFKRKTSKEIQRNHHRARNFREQIQPAKRQRNSSPEITRQNSHSNSLPNLEVSECNDNSVLHSPTIHDLSGDSECVILDKSSHECKPVEPTQENKQSPVKPDGRNELSVIPSGNSPQCKSVEPVHENKPPVNPDATQLRGMSEKKCLSPQPQPQPRIRTINKYGCTRTWCKIVNLANTCLCTRECDPCGYCSDDYAKLCEDCRGLSCSGYPYGYG